MAQLTIPTVATLACVLFSARIAFVYLRKSPRLFTVMALFAFSWALLLPYWAEGDSSKRAALIPVYTGFLEIYVGALLALHASAGHERADEIVPWQAAGLYLLTFVVAPSSLVSSLQLPYGDAHLPYDVAGNALSIIAWIFITRAVKRIAGVRASVVIGSVLFVYAVVGVADTLEAWSRSPTAPSILLFAKQQFLPPPAEYEHLFDYLFAALKSIYTLVLGGIVAYVGMPDDDRNAGLWHWVCLFLKIKGSLPQTAKGHA